jgi:hypothetical protein
MLIEFSVANYLSFKDKVTLSMEAGNIKEYEEDNTFVAGKYHLLKSAAIYGANASGKSNLIKAMDFMKWMITRPTYRDMRKVPVSLEPFLLDSSTDKKASFFEVQFIIENKIYRYGFEINNIEIKSEWLFEVGKSIKNLFIRDRNEIILSKSFKEGNLLEERTKNDILFLWVTTQFNGTISNKITDWFDNFSLISGIQDFNYEGITQSLILSEKDKSKILDLLKYADLGIEDIVLHNKRKQITFTGLSEDEANELSIKRFNFGEQDDDKDYIRKYMISGNLKLGVYTKHKKWNDDNNENVFLDLDRHESEGTKKYFNLLGLIILYLKSGGVLIIDEIDAKLHPVLTKQIIKLFNSKETNPKNAQLIFATHDTNLLSAGILRRDQIWFTEKNRQGATDLYSLLEFKLEDDSKVRNDASFEKDYLKGRYGAIPYLGDFSKIFKPEN